MSFLAHNGILHPAIRLALITKQNRRAMTTADLTPVPEKRHTPMMSSTSPTFTDASARREWFGAACDLLGGQRAMARVLDVGERSVRAWLAGDRGLSDGVIADVSNALRKHGAACQQAADYPPP